MKILLGRDDLNLDELGWDGQIPLLWDAENAYPQAMALLWPLMSTYSTA